MGVSFDEPENMWAEYIRNHADDPARNRDREEDKAERPEPSMA
jgi:hypothetical protein